MKFPSIADVWRASLSDLTIIFYQFVTGKGIDDIEEFKNMWKQAFCVFVYKDKYWINTAISTRFITFLMWSGNLQLLLLSMINFYVNGRFGFDVFGLSIHIAFYLLIYYLFIFYLEIDNIVMHATTCAFAFVFTLLFLISNYVNVLFLSALYVIALFFYGNALLKILLGATSGLGDAKVGVREV